MGIPFAIIWFLRIGQFLSKRHYEALERRLTKKQLKYKKGVLVKAEKTIPLEELAMLPVSNSTQEILSEIRSIIFVDPRDYVEGFTMF